MTSWMRALTASARAMRFCEAAMSPSSASSAACFTNPSYLAGRGRSGCISMHQENRERRTPPLSTFADSNSVSADHGHVAGSVQTPAPMSVLINSTILRGNCTEPLRGAHSVCSFVVMRQLMSTSSFDRKLRLSRSTSLFVSMRTCRGRTWKHELQQANQDAHRVFNVFWKRLSILGWCQEAPCKYAFDEFRNRRILVQASMDAFRHQV